jgi:Bacterial PH domain
MNKGYMTQIFDGQRDDEEVVEVFRRHIIAMRKGFYMLLIPFLICSLPFLIFQDPIELFYLSFAGLGVGILLFAYQWVGWYYTYFILTNQRIRQVSQQGLFGKSVVDLGLSKIQNISYNVPGFSGEVFGFGTIVIQTYVGDLVLDRIDHPERIYNHLQDAVTMAGGSVSDDQEN